MGRRRVDARRQRPDGQRRPAARLQPLQDVPGLRQTAVKAFVTGGTGFVGAHLVQALRARGDQVTCLVRNPAKAHALGWSDVRLVQGDLDDAAALRDGCAGADLIYHVAGRISARDTDEFMRGNRDGTANVLEAASHAPPQRFVLVSSLAAGGTTSPGHPIDEARPPAPVTPYGQSKLAAEVLVRAMPFPWTIVRPPTVYGEWDHEVLKVFKLARRGIVPVFGDGSQELSVIYAGDLAGALVAAATSPAAARKVYYAAHPTVTTSRDLVRAVGRAVGRDPRIVPLPEPVARGPPWAIGTLALVARAVRGALCLLAPRARGAGRVGRFLGDWYPMLLLGGLYAEVGVLNVDVGYQHDVAIQRLELWMFGSQVSYRWIREWPNPVFAWIMHICYIAYYAILFPSPAGLLLG